MIQVSIHSKTCKTMKKYIYTIVAVTAMLASCSQDAEFNEIIDNQSKAITEIGASTSAETRAVISSSDNTKVNWETGDQLGAFGEGATGAVAYTLDGTGGSTSGTFKNASSTIIAVQAMMYPYQNTATWASSTLTCEIPTVQTATAGSFDKNAAIMYSIGSETNATLNYGVAFLKVNIPSGTTNVHAITVYSSTALSGKVDITSTGVAAASTGSQTYVTLQADASNGALAAGDYYIAVKPGSKENLSIAYKYTDHTAKAKQGSSGGSLFLEKGHVKAISADFNTGTVREAKQLWADGPYFAEFNVGSTITSYANVTLYDEVNVGGYYTWGGSTSKSTTDQYSGTEYDSNGNLKPENDTATKLWGSAWRMPTKAELEALINTSNTEATWLDATADSNQYASGCTLKGRKYVGKNGYSSNSVFFPAAGYSISGCVGSLDLVGSYWSSSPHGGYYAYCLDFDSGDQYVYYDARSVGSSVRAVLK